jgi:hypothetical protein
MLFQPLPLVSLSANKKKHTGEQSERLTSKYCCSIGVMVFYTLLLYP